MQSRYTLYHTNGPPTSGAQHWCLGLPKGLFPEKTPNQRGAELFDDLYGGGKAILKWALEK
jgi:hypothetical protein